MLEAGRKGCCWEKEGLWIFVIGWRWGQGGKGGSSRCSTTELGRRLGGGRTEAGGAEGFPWIFTVGQTHQRHYPHCSEGLPEIHCSQRYLTVTRVFCVRTKIEPSPPGTS